MSDTKQTQKKPVLRSNDFRYLPCDAINLAVSDNGIKLILGVEELDGSTLDMIGVHMTHKTAMLLKAVLAQGLEHYQSHSGTVLEEPEINPQSTPE